ncbi:isocitrate lyase/phosphoenolpyruvate mutase family protein [Kitasatospora sp. MAP5-34]|uniref:isocitrate lyase/PEP mutase family protein n=1 Tax=Kitasatospora sp. MAP5-34 TaxID=3035102 RepID=UPI00247515D4|nr:isocitrate lyase/phosphoenolpyruvate mutase family protein [Kitasatospora sp. MAP5-34]
MTGTEAMTGTQARAAATAFRALHRGRPAADPLVLANPWDAVSARAFAEAGFPALATSSGAIAAVLGYADGEQTPVDEMFAAVARIVRSVDVPVTADLEAGYGLPPAELVERLLAAGAVGCNLEDSDPATGKLKPIEEHAAWLAEFQAESAGRLVLNARVDTFLYGDKDVSDAVARSRRYAEAGADCVYPILAPTDLLPELAAGAGIPVNALALPGGPSPKQLGRLGATRVTFGHTLHNRITATVQDLARELSGA